MTSTAAPAPFGAVPNPRQLAWQRLGMYAFIHFTVNTFTDRNWGDGTEPEDVFNPSELDCEQWCRVISEAGFKGAILTAKHHDGFCLWPSRYTTHSVAASKWRDGHGDVVREFVEAARKFHLKIGFYLSPWDRHEPTYGSGEPYNRYFRNQLRELLENYGGDDVFIAWFDGACGEGPNGKVQHYDCEKAAAVVRECAPNAVLFGAMDDWRDIRWCGNEAGFAGSPNWATIDVYRPDSIHHGDPAGRHYWPAEVDVSIRPEWFYHPNEDSKVHSLSHLIDIFFHSVGRGSCLNLNFPPDRRGLIHENDVRRIREWSTVLRTIFKTDFAAGAVAQSPVSRGPGFEAARLTDGDGSTYWAAPDGVTAGAAVIELGEFRLINVIKLAEYTELGQRVAEFAVDWRDDGGNWRELVRDNTISFRKILRTPTVNADALRLRIIKALASFTISEFGVYYMPPLPLPPAIRRTADGTVTLSAPGARTLRYTLDGSRPGPDSLLYQEQLKLPGAGVIRATAEYDASEAYAGIDTSAESTLEFGVARANWSIAQCDSEDPEHPAASLLDADPDEYWLSARGALPQGVTIDTGACRTFSGAILTHPTPAVRFFSYVRRYRITGSAAAAGPFRTLLEGELDNIANNPVPQTVKFPVPAAVRWVRLEILETAPESRIPDAASLAGFELI